MRLTAAPGRPAAGAHRRRLCLPRRPAPAARSVLDPAGRAGRRRRSTTTRASARTGSGRPSSRPAPAPATSPAARPSSPSSRPSSGAATSTSPPSPTSIRSSARSTPTRSTSGLSAKGVDLKLGRGGIREIEFYVQTQQLILGGRHPRAALATARWTRWRPWPTPARSTPQTAAELTEAYARPARAGAPRADAGRRADPPAARSRRRAAARRRPGRLRRPAQLRRRGGHGC